MTAVLVGNYEPNSPEWHEARTLGIGASEIAAVVGLSPYMSAFELWHRKKGNLPGVPMSDVMEWGHLLEPVVAERFALRHPEYYVRPAGTFCHEGRPWQLANVDRLLSQPAPPSPGKAGRKLLDKGILEIKTSRFGDGYGQSGSDQVPLHVRCQVLQQMDVFGLDHCWVAVLIGGSDYREYVVSYDDADAQALVDAGAAFWESLQADEEPPLDASESTYQTVRELHPDIARDAGADIEPSLYMAYLAAKLRAEQSADDYRLVKSNVLTAMGDARLGLVADVAVFRRQPGRNGSVSLYTIGETA